MVFFNSSMASSLQKSSTSVKNKANKSSEFGKKVRTLPGCVSNWKENVWRTGDATITNAYKITTTNRKLLFMHSLLKSQIIQLSECQGAFEVEKLSALFASYVINRENLLFDNGVFKMFEAKNNHMPKFVIMAKVYPVKAMHPENSLQLKLLRHLGRKHPYIVHTWEIFYDKESIYVFQELVVNGSLVAYLEGNSIDEAQAITWSKQIWHALDFLGDIGIAHRAITPSHLLIRGGPFGCIKLTGFRNAIVYWNIDHEDVKLCPCWPAERTKTDGPNFQAPEVYGDADKEVFDPIKADIWSFGANVYFMLAKQYPFNILAPNDNVDEEIWYNIGELPNLSDDGKKFLMNMMRGNANDRIPFYAIIKDSWFARAKGSAGGASTNMASVGGGASINSEPMKKGGGKAKTKGFSSADRAARPRTKSISAVSKGPTSIGGASIGGASVGRKSIGGSSAAGNSISGSSVAGTSIAGESIGGSSVGGNSIGGSSVGGSSVGGASIGGSSVGGNSIGGSSVGGNSIGGSSVGGASIGGSSVGGASMGGQSVGGASIGGSSVGGNSIGGSSVAENSIGGSSVGGASIGGQSVGGASIGGSSVGGNSIGGSSVAENSIGGSSVGGASIGGQSMGGTSIGGSSVAGTSIGGSSVAGTSIGGSSAAENSIGGSSVGGASIGGSSVAGTSIGGSSAAENSIGGSSVAGASIGGSSVGGNSMGGSSVGGASIGGGSISGKSKNLAKGGEMSGRSIKGKSMVKSISGASAAFSKKTKKMKKKK